MNTLQPIADELKIRRGPSREMALEIAAVLIPVIRKHRGNFGSFDEFGSVVTLAVSIVAACAETVNHEQ